MFIFEAIHKTDIVLARWTDLGGTVRELLSSPRMRVAVAKYAEGDTSFMKALLTELALEAEKVMRSAVVRTWQVNQHLDSHSMKSVLRRVGVSNCKEPDADEYTSGLPKKDANECNTYDLNWQLSKNEVKYFLAEHMNPEVTEEQKKKLLDSVLREYNLL